MPGPLASWRLPRCCSTRAAPRGRRPRARSDERARDGIAYLFRDRTLAVAMSVLFLTLLFMTASVTAEVFFLKEDLEVSDAVYGAVFGAWTVGMIVGALVVARRVPHRLLALGLLVATLVQGIGLGLPTAWLVVWFGAAMWFIGGAGHGTKNTLARTLIQERVPDRLHGRAFAAYNAMRNGAELVALGVRRRCSSRHRRTHDARAGRRGVRRGGAGGARALPAPGAHARAGARALTSPGRTTANHL